jgi:hypothetical protein
MLPAVAMNVVEVALAGTVTEEGTGSRLLLLANPTAVPPFCAAFVSVTVHVVAAPEFRVVGVHASDDATTGATSMIVAVCDDPFRLAVKVAL